MHEPATNTARSEINELLEPLAPAPPSVLLRGAKLSGIELCSQVLKLLGANAHDAPNGPERERRHIVCLRNPGELGARPADFDEGAWLTCYMQIFGELRAQPLCVIEYESWAEHPQTNIDKLTRCLDIDPESVPAGAVAAAVADGIRQDPPRGGAPRQAALAKFYDLLRRWEDDAAARERALAMIDDFACFRELHLPRVREHEELVQRVAAMEEAAQYQIEQMLEKIAAAQEKGKDAYIARLHAAFRDPAAATDEFMRSVVGWRREPAARAVTPPPAGTAATPQPAPDRHPAERRLILHIGGPKTGSSALQLFFARNADLLRRHGISYNGFAKPTHDYEPAIGNGYPLYLALLNGHPDIEIKSLLKSHFEASKVALISNETICGLPIFALQRLKNIFNDLKIVPKIFIYIRDVFSLFQSDYHQRVKSAGESRSFSQYMEEGTSYLFSHALKNWIDVFDKEICHVFHYDSVKDNIGQCFIDLVGFDANQFDYNDLKKVINRSLTRREVDFLRQINKRFGPSITNGMSTALLYSEPDAVKAEYVSDTWIRLLEERHGEEVRWINDTFFGGREVLKIYNGPLDMPRVESPKGLSARTWEALTRWAFERLAAAETESVAQIQEYFGRYIDATPDSAYAEKIPADFNPIEYLSLWPDLVAARVNPFDHYVRHGIAEGRAYRVTG
jgi:hypothetical protein